MSAESTVIEIERLGGIAGFGGPGAHVRSRGRLAYASLTATDQALLDQAFKSVGKRKVSLQRDRFSYRVSRTDVAGTVTIEVAAEHLPTALVQCVVDELV